MYTEIAKFEFVDTIPQSARFRFLESLAVALERATVTEVGSESPGFSVELDRNGKTKVTIWHPRKRDVLFSHLLDGYKSGAIRVTQPRKLIENMESSNDA